MAITATVDDVEGEPVKLLIGEHEAEAPLAELPEGTEKSNVLRLEFALAQRTQAGAWKEPGRGKG